MRNTGMEETQAGIKIAGRNINNLKYADDTTLIYWSVVALQCCVSICCTVIQSVICYIPFWGDFPPNKSHQSIF